jgi:hypothetical protein
MGKDWTVKLKPRTLKGLPQAILDKVVALSRQMEKTGPKQPKWPNFGELYKTRYPDNAKRYHCHLKKGKPTYVAVWKVLENNTIEIDYVGTHENAPY